MPNPSELDSTFTVGGVLGEEALVEAGALALAELTGSTLITGACGACGFWLILFSSDDLLPVKL